MEEFNYVNYCTVYSSEGDIDHVMGKDCCFHTVTKDGDCGDITNSYEVHFFKGLDFLHDTEGNNACFLSREDIETHLNIIKGVYPFEFSLKEKRDCYGVHDKFDDEYEDNEDYDEEHDDMEYEYWSLNLKISGNILYHKFILKMIRPLYEYPFNMALMDVIKLKRINPFRLYGTINLYLMLGYLFNRSKPGGISDQFICETCYGFPKFIKKQVLQERLKMLSEKYERPNMNDVYEYIFIKGVSDKLELGKLATDYTATHSLEYWQSEEEFNKRVEIYTKYLPYFKSVKNND